MKNLIIISLLLLLSCNTKNTPENTYSIIQDSKEIEAIKKILKSQQNSWNNGNIEEFMKGYWKSEDLIFSSAKYKTAYGWEETLKRYKESYPNKESMGKLSFEIVEIKITSTTKAELKGKWELIRKNDNPNGYFWLNLKKFDKDWLITKDSTLTLNEVIPSAY